MRINKKALSEISKIENKTPVFRKIKGVLTKDTLELGSITHQSKPSKKINPFEHWLKNISFSKETKANNEATVKELYKNKGQVDEIIDETESVKNHVRNLFNDETLRHYGLNPEEIEVQFRVKGKKSALKKCNDKIDELHSKAETTLKEKKLDGFTESKEQLEDALTIAKNPTQELRDIAGIRFVLKNPSQETVDKYTLMLADMHKKKQLRLKKFTLYGDELSYLQERNIDTLKACSDNIKVSRPKLKVGYIASQCNLIIPVEQGDKTLLVRMEQQIRSSKIDKIAEHEHDLTYKPGPLTEKFNKLTPSLKEKYIASYLHDCYHSTRKKELGIPAKKPPLSKEIPDELSFEEFL